MVDQQASLYFHVPFCARKCPYCHFYVTQTKEQAMESYMRALFLEWKMRSPLLEGKEIVSVYLGGGTPSQLGKERIEEILSWLPPLSSDCEVTLEANPEDITDELLLLTGINRISMGVQSFDDELLKTLGRGHSATRAKEAIKECAAAFGNVTIDLMYELPRQTLGHWKSSLETAAELPLQHLSLYNLTFEEGTAFTRKKERLTPLLPPEDQREAFFLLPEQILPLKRYEISAFALPGFESRHNTGYWQGRPFLGFGPSACSYWQGARSRNRASLIHWQRSCEKGISPIDFEEKLDPEPSLREHLIIGLRLFEGVAQKTLPKETAHLMDGLIQEGLIEDSAKRWRLTPKGRLFHDTVAERLV